MHDNALPQWKMASDRERQDGHLWVTGARERQVGSVTQVIERVMVSPTSAYEHPGYRLVEISQGQTKVLPHVETTLRDARHRFDRRAGRG